MSVSSKRSETITYSGDVVGTEISNAATNASSPGQIEVKTFTGAGDNTVTIPTGATGVRIMPPSANTQALTLKGVAGDTGILIHKTDYTSIALGAASSFVINVAGTVTGIRFMWT